ncbi:amidophosphoribosyltransferase [Thermaurantimonas aggregans]|uniref:amidophosphoribosyltransferase n=1 Tax=Thermaurantimonas aggregans TaxID=2173829 RepID=UPI0023F3DD41|nr:amidophosphoribosyltransferase [Thermaurantimonas aggregans]MCX8149086.1 amidophosphoribosyltransferase [Thermaurantimonas aggregans]
MSDSLQHECGIALLRLLKPLDYYREKYKTAFYGLNKMYLLMEKQHNRGQDGAGLASIKFDMQPGQRYISRIRSNDPTPIKDIFARIKIRFSETLGSKNPEDLTTQELKELLPYIGEVYLGHLRYGTYGGNSIEQCHPFLRQNNWMTRNLLLAGNFNMTNVDQLFNKLISLGQHPKEKADTVTILEKIGHFLDKENEEIYQKYRKAGYSKKDISPLIAQELDVANILKKASKHWDGGYVMAGLLGHGDAFVLRDPNGIRPAFYYVDNEIIAVASERPVLQTTFNVPLESVQELEPGHALIIKRSGQYFIKKIKKDAERRSCSFERIYFSRGNDAGIYQERISFGKSLLEPILKTINYDLENTVFSYIPNTAEVAYYGLIQGLNEYLNTKKAEQLAKAGKALTQQQILSILNQKIRMEKVAWKDAKLRTFITEDASRSDLVSHVYDVTYGIIRPSDTLVVLDDSIVRGTTLRDSILKILDRLNPKHIVVASSAPQIRYPDCYGIDMARLGDFAAFQAAVALHWERGTHYILNEVYQQCKAYLAEEDPEPKNLVKAIYKPFTVQEISDKMAELLSPPGMKAKVSFVFQSIESLHQSSPMHTGDWYFTGDYPTPGGMRVVNKAFVHYMEGNPNRAY